MNEAGTAEELYQEGLLAEQAKDYQRAKLLLERSLFLEKDNENKEVCRNILGRVYEKLGDVEAAINLYEQNVSGEFMGNFPYDRLRVIYCKKKRFGDAIRVLEVAVRVFDEMVSVERGDRQPKLENFRQQLEKVKKESNKIENSL